MRSNSNFKLFLLVFDRKPYACNTLSHLVEIAVSLCTLQHVERTHLACQNIIMTSTKYFIFGINRSIYKGTKLHFLHFLISGLWCLNTSILREMTAEKDAKPNKTLRGFNLIDDIKSNLEQQYPQTVSCADILEIATRDAIALWIGSFLDHSSMCHKL